MVNKGVVFILCREILAVKHLKSVYYQCSGENLTFIPVLTTHETETDYI